MAEGGRKQYYAETKIGGTQGMGLEDNEWGELSDKSKKCTNKT